MRASGSPKPGTGRPQYVSSRNAARFSAATRSRHSTSRGHARQVTISSASASSESSRSTSPDARRSAFRGAAASHSTVRLRTSTQSVGARHPRRRNDADRSSVRSKATGSSQRTCPALETPMSVDHALLAAELTARHGVTTTARLERLGFSERRVRTLVSRGQLARAVRGVLVASAWPDGLEHRMALACAATGGVVCFPTAGLVWELRRSPRTDETHVAIHEGRRIDPIPRVVISRELLPARVRHRSPRRRDRRHLAAPHGVRRGLVARQRRSRVADRGRNPSPIFHHPDTPGARTSDVQSRASGQQALPRGHRRP